MVSTLKLTKIQIPNSDSDVLSFNSSTGIMTFHKDITGEGTNTTNLQQGLAKVWANLNGTGDYTAHFTTAFSNDDFSVTSGGANGSASATAYHLSTFDHSTTSVEMESFAVSASSVAKADRSQNNMMAHGDLA